MFSKKKSSAKSKSVIKNIVTVNAYAQKYYLFKDDTFKPLNKLFYNTSNFITSYVSNKDIITTTVEISRSIPEEDIADVLDIKAYEELGLDQASDYIINYYEVENGGEEREFHIFVAEPSVLTDLFLPVKEQTKYIDLIVPAPLLYKSLYHKEILSDQGTHCFVYFTRYDAFITIYKYGEYIYSKSIEFSLEQIYEKYCELIGEKVDEKEFYTVLETEGLKTTKNEYQQTFMKIFGEIFITINDVIIYVKRAYKLDTIDQLFIGSVNGPIIGLDEYSQNYLGLQSSDFNFNYNIDTDEWYTDQLQYLMLLTSFEYLEDDESVVNMTIFPRPPSFVNRPGGQFLIAIFAAISIGLAYPLVYLIGSYINDAKIYALKIQNDKLQTEAQKYKTILGKKRQEIKSLDNQINKLSATYNAKSKTLTSIYDKKVNYRLKSGTFYQIAEDMNKFGVYVDNIRTNDNQLFISLVSPNDRKLTELIKYISDTHFDEIQEIDIELIEKDPESKYYRGVLKVVLR
jgi:hypothetical protein